MADRRAISFILFLVLFFYLSGQQQPRFLPQPQLDGVIASEKRRLDVLRSTRYGDFNPQNGQWLNLTGLREEDGFGWELLALVKDKAREQARTVLERGGLIGKDGGDLPWEELDAVPVPAYRNATGWIDGKWVRSKLEPNIPHLSVNLSAIVPSGTYLSQSFLRNVTSSAGRVQLRLTEEDGSTGLDTNDTVKHIQAQLELAEGDSVGRRWDVHLHGVHFEDTGRVVLTTSSEKFSGFFVLPHLTLSERSFNASQRLLNVTISKLIQDQEAHINTNSNLWSSTRNIDTDEGIAAPRCEYVVYLQQYTVPLPSNKAFGSVVPSDAILLLEDELRFPTGAPYPRPPHTTMSMTIFSPDCGFILESKGPPQFVAPEGNHLRGPKAETFVSDGRDLVLIYSIIMIAQIFIYKEQLKDACTPSTRSRVSFWTIAMLTVADTLTIMIVFLFSMLSSGASLPLLAAAFIAFVLVAFFGMNFMFNIWVAQAPERRQRESRDANRQRTALVSSTSEIDTLPLPVTPRQAISSGATPIILELDQDPEPQGTTAEADTATQMNDNPARQFASIYARFVLFTSSIMFLSLNATTWPTAFRSMYTNALLFVYFSFWWPQIYRNVMRNCRRALRWDFIVWQSILRLLPMLYFYCYHDNLLFVQNDWNAAAAFLGWVWLQCCVLAGQEILGPRFFVRDAWVPPAYDYHRVIREDEEEATMPLGRRQSSASIGSLSTAGHQNKRLFDCAICKESIEVPVVPADGHAAGSPGISGNILARRAYMVTPCRHIFHTQCLEDWMKYRLVCPNCRETLPAI